MGLLTGTPLGTIVSQEDLYVEGAAYVYFQDATATPLNNPDSDSYYWGLSGTASYNVYNLGCIQDVSFGEDVTVNAVRCDTEGDKDVVQRRNYVEVTLTVASLFPLSVLAPVMNASTPVKSGGWEKMGIGPIDNSKRYHIYMPKVYDEVTGDFVIVHIHKAKFVDAWSLSMKSGEPWTLTGIKMRGFADSTKPSGQSFATVVRADSSALP